MKFSSLQNNLKNATAEFLQEKNKMVDELKEKIKQRQLADDPYLEFADDIKLAISQFKAD